MGTHMSKPWGQLGEPWTREQAAWAESLASSPSSQQAAVAEAERLLQAAEPESSLALYVRLGAARLGDRPGPAACALAESLSWWVDAPNTEAWAAAISRWAMEGLDLAVLDAPVDRPSPGGLL